MPVAKIVKPVIEKKDAVCLDEPRPDLNVRTDLDLAKYNEVVRLAGADCRTKFHAVVKQVDVKP